MTNKEILELFEKNYPEVNYKDYRPFYPEFAEKRQGITIWTENDDVIFYFPNPNKPTLVDSDDE